MREATRDSTLANGPLVAPVPAVLVSMRSDAPSSTPAVNGVLHLGAPLFQGGALLGTLRGHLAEAAPWICGAVRAGAERKSSL